MFFITWREVLRDRNSVRVRDVLYDLLSQGTNAHGSQAATELRVAITFVARFYELISK